LIDEKWFKNKYIALMANAIKKKIPETTRILIVVLGDSTLVAKVIINVDARNTKVPKLKRNLFAPK
jgi:hypothetical protein